MKRLILKSVMMSSSVLKKYEKSLQLEKRSLGINVAIPQDTTITLSEDMLRKLKERSDSLKSEDTKPVAKPASPKFKP